MRRLLFTLPLLAMVISAQISCTRPSSSSESKPAASPSPTEQERINQILDRYENALGGRAAIEGVTSYKMKGTFQLPRMTGKVEGWGKEPGKKLFMVHFDRIGTLRKGFDGETHWVQTPAGTFTDSNPQEIAKMERDVEAFSAAKIRSQFESMKLENRARLHGRDMNVIEGKPAKGPAEKLFFDVENGLLVRWDMARREANRGTVFVKVHLEDYREAGGVKVPFSVRFAFESFSFAIKFDEVQYNAPIDDAVFRKP